jgi:hypothetical protein
MAGKRGDGKRKQPTKAADTRRPSPRKSPRKFKSTDSIISDLSDDEHLQNEVKQKKSTKTIFPTKIPHQSKMIKSSLQYRTSPRI